MTELKMEHVLVFVIIVFLLYLSICSCMRSNEGFNVGVKYSLNQLPNFSNCNTKDEYFPKIFTCSDLKSRQLTIDALCTNLKGVCDNIDPSQGLCDKDFFTDCKRYISGWTPPH